MIIKSLHEDSFVRIEPNEEGMGPVFSVTCSFDGHSLTNDGIVFVKTEQFLGSLDEFRTTRKGVAELSGTEDLRITIEPDGHSGYAWCSFHISRTLYGHRFGLGRAYSGDVSLTGGFTVDSEFVDRLARDFADTLRKSPA